MSGAVDLPYRTAPVLVPPARAAGVASVLLGLLLLTELPGVWRAAAYLGVLTATFAACALVAGAWLWRRGELCARATAGGAWAGPCSNSCARISSASGSRPFAPKWGGTSFP